MPKFSVIIPIYNAEKYLESCLDSLIQQNYTDFELILVNDCSLDSSYSICKKYAKDNKNIILINQEKNLGVSAARNRGIEIAKGSYILFVDSDDFVTSNYFETIDKIISNNKAELFVIGNYDYFVYSDGSTSTALGKMNCNVSSQMKNAWNKLFLETFYASPWNKVFLKSILINFNIRFDLDCVCYEDYLFNIEYCKYINTFISVKFPLYYYRQYVNVDHISKRKWGKRFDISEKVAKSTNEFISLKSERESLSNLRRYTYQAFLTELKAAAISEDDYQVNLKKVINNREFLLAINSISPLGKKLHIFKFAKKLHLNCICENIIKDLIQ